MIDGDSLAAFIMVAEERSFSRAADRIGTAQSVVSKRLRRLEDQLATQLVDRRVRNDIQLTRIGRLYLPEAVETLAQLDKAKRTGTNLGRGIRGPLRIGFVFSAAMNGTLTAILTGLCSALPDLELQPRLMETPEQLAALKAGQLDLGLLRPRPSYPADCNARDIHSEPLMACMSTSDPLATREQLTPQDFADQCFIVPQFHERVGLIDSIQALARAGRFEMPRVIPTGDFVTAVCLASARLGIVLAPASLANLAISGTSFRSVAGFGEQLRTTLVYRTDAPSEAIQQISGFFQ